MKKLATLVTDVWVKAGFIPSADVQVYLYGVELLISTIFNLCNLVLISVLFGNPLTLIPYLISFIPLRMFGGGYHAKTHWGCVAITSAAYFVTCLFTTVIANKSLQIIYFAVSIVGFLLLLALAPVPAKNKPLSPKEMHSYKAISLIMSLALIGLALAVILKAIPTSLSLTFLYLGEVVSTIMLVAGKMER